MVAIAVSQSRNQSARTIGLVDFSRWSGFQTVIRDLQFKALAKEVLLAGYPSDSDKKRFRAHSALDADAYRP